MKLSRNSWKAWRSICKFVPFLHGLFSSISLRTSKIEIDASIESAFPTEATARSFILELYGYPNPLEIPGQYVLVITHDGRKYYVDAVQTFGHGNVVGVHEAKPVPSSITFPWFEHTCAPIQAMLAEFELLINSKTAKEGDFQKFFEQHHEFLLLLGNYDDVRSQVTFKSETPITPFVASKTYRPDFFLHNAVTDLWDVLDIKPVYLNVPLIRGSGANAHNALAPSFALRKALQQMKEYRRALEQRQVREMLEETYGMKTMVPTCILMIGREENFPTLSPWTPLQAIKTISREEGVDLITLDQLYRIARHKGF